VIADLVFKLQTFLRPIDYLVLIIISGLVIVSKQENSSEGLQGSSQGADKFFLNSSKHGANGMHLWRSTNYSSYGVFCIQSNQLARLLS